MTDRDTSILRDEAQFKRGLVARQFRGTLWKRFFALSTLIAIAALIALFFNVANRAFGYVISEYDPDISAVVETGDVRTLTNDQLAQLIATYAENRLRVIIRNDLSVVANDQFTTAPLSVALAGSTFAAEWNDLTINDLAAADWTQIISTNLSHDRLVEIILTDIVDETIHETFTFSESLFDSERIKAHAAETYPHATLYFRTWIDWNFITNPGSSDPTQAGIRTALLGSLWVIAITILFAFPIGVGAALYLEEYAADTPLNRLIETNIRNLAGVPSIIYGLLGLAIFVRTLSALTSGAWFGITDSNGRTILSAGLTMGLLILPVIIINSQEALRAVPFSIREGSYGLGATKWQTIWRNVLPAALPGILTGTILGVSRAIGETAPLIIVGASTTILSNSPPDPNSPFSAFTAIPLQIYQWTARPQDEFKTIAAAAILVLLVVLISLNATAIILRQRFRRSLSA